MKKWIDILFSFAIGAAMLLAFTKFATWYGWATYDLGIMQKLFLAAAEFPIIHGINKLYFWWSFPMLFKYVDKDLNEKNGWNALTENQKTIAGFCLRCWDLLCLVLLVALQ